MLTPRGSIPDAEILQTPRDARSLNAAEVPVDFRRYQRERFECYAGKMTHDVNQKLHHIVRNAMVSGKTHFRLQTLRMPIAFSYAYNKLEGTLPIYHAHTLRPIEKTTARVRFNQTFMKPLLDWMMEQGIHFYCTTTVMSDQVSFGNLPLAGHINIEAYLIPEDTDLREKHGPLLSLWNGVYTIKCLDASMLGEWNKRVLAAFRTGASHCIICTLYMGSDYDDTPKDQQTNLPTHNEYTVVNPRNHLTMELLNPMPDWSLKENKFTVLLSWVTQLNYKWTLLCGWSDEEKRPSHWAYFSLLLDPLEKIY